MGPVKGWNGLPLPIVARAHGCPYQAHTGFDWGCYLDSFVSLRLRVGIKEKMHNVEKGVKFGRRKHSRPRKKFAKDVILPRSPQEPHILAMKSVLDSTSCKQVEKMVMVGVHVCQDFEY